jgi:hypothetical protein
MKLSHWVFIASVALSGSVRASRDCLPYEPSKVTLEGILKEVTYPGPPNYQSISAGDAAETQLVLTLANPICVAAPADPRYSGGIDTSVGAARQITLVPFKKMPALPHLPAKVRVTGELFHAHTGHHHTELLLQLSDFHVV